MTDKMAAARPLCGVEWGPAGNRRTCVLAKGHPAARNGFGHWCPDTAMTVTVSGPQGCGKSTLTRLLRAAVERGWDQETTAVVFKERQTGEVRMTRTKLQVLADALAERMPEVNMEHLLRCAILQVIEEREDERERSAEEADCDYL
jgi:ABC-type molybdenum transport system ATPase subunit/photorepair protein PhrA